MRFEVLNYFLGQTENIEPQKNYTQNRDGYHPWGCTYCPKTRGGGARLIQRRHGNNARYRCGFRLACCLASTDTAVHVADPLNRAL